MFLTFRIERKWKALLLVCFVFLSIIYLSSCLIITWMSNIYLSIIYLSIAWMSVIYVSHISLITWMSIISLSLNVCHLSVSQYICLSCYHLASINLWFVFIFFLSVLFIYLSNIISNVCKQNKLVWCILVLV